MPLDATCLSSFGSHYKKLGYIKCDQCPTGLIPHLSTCVSQCPTNYVSSNGYCVCQNSSLMTINA